MKKIEVSEDLFASKTLGGHTEEEEAEIAAAKAKLERLQKEAGKNDQELEKLLETNKKKADLRNKRESYRERSIKAREGKKKRLREMAKQFWGVVKIILAILGVICAIVGVTAILGCEYQMDGIKDLPICSFGKNPNNDDGDRRLLNVDTMDYLVERKNPYNNEMKKKDISVAINDEYNTPDVNKFLNLRGRTRKK